MFERDKSKQEKKRMKERKIRIHKMIRAIQVKKKYIYIY